LQIRFYPYLGIAATFNAVCVMTNVQMTGVLTKFITEYTSSAYQKNKSLLINAIH